MYFGTKFNKEIQTLVRGMDRKGASANIDYMSKNLWQTESFQHGLMKIIPLIMYDKLVSSNRQDNVYDNSVVVAKHRSGTVISAKGESK